MRQGEEEGEAKYVPKGAAVIFPHAPDETPAARRVARTAIERKVTSMELSAAQLGRLALVISGPWLLHPPLCSTSPSSLSSSSLLLRPPALSFPSSSLCLSQLVFVSGSLTPARARMDAAG